MAELTVKVLSHTEDNLDYALKVNEDGLSITSKVSIERTDVGYSYNDLEPFYDAMEENEFDYGTKKLVEKFIDFTKQLVDTSSVINIETDGEKEK